LVFRQDSKYNNILNKEGVMEQAAIGRQLRARRAAAGRTVASVAADASLSVPYIANLENGRGNPTITALTRLAEALGLRLEITLVPEEDGQAGGAPQAPAVPASLVRFARTERFRQAAATMARALGRETDEYTGQLVAALAAMAPAMGQDLSEADQWRVMDALLLIAAYPAHR
jgi:transcriptional regulator with XRE-family HTH domain